MRQAIISHAQLRQILEARRGARIVTLVTVTEPKLRKTNNPYFGIVERVVRRNGMCGASYESSVNRRRDKEVTPTDDQGLVMQFTSRPLPWGEHDGPFFVKHTGKDGIPKTYLKFLPRTNLEEQFRHPITKQVYSDETVAVIKTFLYTSHGSRRQAIENTVDWRTIALNSIEQIKIDGELYGLVPFLTQASAAAA